MGTISSANRGRKPSGFQGGPGELEQEIQLLLTLDVTALRRKWAALFDSDPSPYLGRMFMVRAIAYRLQERAFGGLKPSVRRLLDRICDSGRETVQKTIPRRLIGAGTVLIREWHGVKHRVTVLDGDVLYRNRRYKSLSEVAREITGTQWSGPLFFGLTNRAKEVARG